MRYSSNSVSHNKGLRPFQIARTVRSNESGLFKDVISSKVPTKTVTEFFGSPLYPPFSLPSAQVSALSMERCWPNDEDAHLRMLHCRSDSHKTRRAEEMEEKLPGRIGKEAKEHRHRGVDEDEPDRKKESRGIKRRRERE